MLKFLIVRELPVLSNDGRKQLKVKLVLNKEQYVERVCRRFREVVGEELYTVDIHEGLKRTLNEINDDFEQEKMQFA